MAGQPVQDDAIMMPLTVVRPEPDDPAQGVPSNATAGIGLTPGNALAEMERRAAAGQLSPRAVEALAELKKRKGLTSTESRPLTNMERLVTGDPLQEESIVRPIGIAATGFNKGLAGFVDLLNEGLKATGLPMSDEPFMGSAFVDKYLGGAALQPQNMMESVLQRAGLEVGANAPLLGAGLAARGAKVATEAAKGTNKAMEAEKAGSGAFETSATLKETGKGAATGGSPLDAIKNIPGVIVEQMAQVDPAKLAALESALAAGAGVGAGTVEAIFPEGGPLAEFVGEVVGGFAPAVALGMVQKAKEMGHGLVRTVAGSETTDEAKRRLGGKLAEAATKEQIDTGVKQAEALRQEISPGAEPGEGLQLSAGEAIKEGAVTATQKSQVQASVELSAKLNDQRAQNIEAVRNYFTATAPDGNPTTLIETLEGERSRVMGLLDIGLERTQAKVEAIRGNINKRMANLLNDVEAKMQAADQRIAARVRAIGPVLGKKQRGEMIRQEYQKEVGKFRERSRADYAELDNLEHAELPVGGVTAKLAELEDQFPAQIQAIRKINPSVARAIDNLGHDYELISRAEKAQADLEMVGGKGKDQRGGFRVLQEQDGQGGTQQVIGVPSNYPYWYRELTSKKLKIHGEDLVMDRETVEKALDTIRTGTKHGLHEETIAEVKKSIMADSEFKKTPFYDPIMEDLNHTPSAGLKDLRQVRSDLLALSRNARAADDRTQNYVLHELISAVDNDIDQLLPGQSVYADRYPDHGTLYRQISADYRAGVDALMRGTANKLRRVNKYGDYTQDDESIPALFWRNETSIEHFQKAFQNPAEAKIALRDYALERFYDATVMKKDGRLFIDAGAAEEWLAQHEPQLKLFPDLKAAFTDTVKMQEDVDALHKQVALYTQGKKGEERLLKQVMQERQPGDFTPADLSNAEARLKHVQDVVERTKSEWEASKATLFLKEPANYAGMRIATARNPVGEYEKVVKRLKGDPDAIMGLNKAIWEALTEKIQPRLRGLSGDMNLGVFHKELQDWLTVHADLMQRVLGEDGFKRIERANEAIERIARGKHTGSDTAINLQVQAALASTWLSRGWAAMSGRVPVGFGVGERVMQHLIKTMERMTAKQQNEILLDAFFNPKAFQALVDAATYGPENRMVKKKLALHLHALNLSEQMPEGGE